jgi:predicted Zn-dependent protease
MAARKEESMKPAYTCFSIVAMALFLFSCATNPVTGRTELMLLSEQDEIAMGRSTDPEVVQTYGIYENVSLGLYIRTLGRSMGIISHRPQLTYEFKVMDSPVINAFAVPGGYVYLTRGILAYLNSEAELAGVMGHEIGHITARHSAQQYSKAQVAQLGLGLGSLISPTFAQVAGLAAQGVGVLFLKFSRDNEREADSLGVEYSSKVGYDAREMTHFFNTLNSMQDSKQGSLPDFLSTHPNPENRVGAITVSAQQWQTKLNLTNPRINRSTYLGKIDGLVFGDDPRQGFVENSRFYHPALKFMFPVPSGWKLENLPAQVQIISGDEQAAILFNMGSEATPGAEARKFLKESGATVLSQKETSVNGLKCLVLASSLASQSGVLTVLSYFINRDSSVFVFHGFCARDNFTARQKDFQQTMNGFQTLRDADKLAVQPDRIRVKTISRRMTLRQALKELGTPEADLKKLSQINGKALTDEVPANSQLKVIVKGR